MSSVVEFKKRYGQSFSYKGNFKENVLLLLKSQAAQGNDKSHSNLRLNL